MNTLGPRLRALRLQAGLSQRELARRARMSNGAVSAIEADKVSPSVSALRQLLAPLGLSLGDFFAAEMPKEWLPFCSKRCQQTDLYRWMTGKYAIVEELSPDQLAEELFLDQNPEDQAD